MSKFKLVTSTIEDNQLFISGEQSNPKISYKVGESIMTVSNSEKTVDRVMLCTELYNRLDNRLWNKTDGCRFFDGTNFFYIHHNKNKPSGIIEEVDQDTEKFLLSEKIITKEDKTYIKAQYNSIFGSSINPYKITEQTTGTVRSVKNTIPIINPTSFTYTDNIDLNPILYNKSNVILQISIMYSDSDNIFTRDLSIGALQNKQLLNSIEYINNNISLEFINGILRVFPISDNILECIISNCTLILN